MNAVVSISREGPIALITIDNPPVNALSQAVRSGLMACIKEAIAVANDSDYGLSSSVWTQNISHAHKIARELVTGQVGINTAMVADWDLPIGGYKQSGWGRGNGFDAVENYLQTKAVSVALYAWKS